MNKPQSPLNQIESEQERQKWLERYPPQLSSTRREGQICLQDYLNHYGEKDRLKEVMNCIEKFG